MAQITYWDLLINTFLFTIVDSAIHEETVDIDTILGPFLTIFRLLSF